MFEIHPITRSVTPLTKQFPSTSCNLGYAPTSLGYGETVRHFECRSVLLFPSVRHVVGPHHRIARRCFLRSHWRCIDRQFRRPYCIHTHGCQGGRRLLAFRLPTGFPSLSCARFVTHAIAGSPLALTMNSALRYWSNVSNSVSSASALGSCNMSPYSDAGGI